MSIVCNDCKKEAETGSTDPRPVSNANARDNIGPKNLCTPCYEKAKAEQDAADA